MSKHIASITERMPPDGEEEETKSCQVAKLSSGTEIEPISGGSSSNNKNCYLRDYVVSCKNKLYPENDVFIFGFNVTNLAEVPKNCIAIDMQTGNCSNGTIKSSIPEEPLMITNRLTLLDTKICLCKFKPKKTNGRYILAFYNFKDGNVDTRPITRLIEFYEILINGVATPDYLLKNSKTDEELKLLKNCQDLAVNLKAKVFLRAIDR